MVRAVRAVWDALPAVERAAFVLALGWLAASEEAFAAITYDDAWISLRYAEHLAGGLGWVFNPGERVEGASNPLWVLMLAGCTALGWPAMTVAKLVGGLAGLLLPVVALALSPRLPPFRANAVGAVLVA